MKEADTTWTHIYVLGNADREGELTRLRGVLRRLLKSLNSFKRVAKWRWTSEIVGKDQAAAAGNAPHNLCPRPESYGGPALMADISS